MKRHLPFREWDVGTNLDVGISIFIISRMQLNFWTNWYKSYYFVDKYDWNWSNSTCISSSVIKCIFQFSWHGNMPCNAGINIQARCAQTADVQKFPNYFRKSTFWGNIKNLSSAIFFSISFGSSIHLSYVLEVLNTPGNFPISREKSAWFHHVAGG